MIISCRRPWKGEFDLTFVTVRIDIISASILAVLVIFSMPVCKLAKLLLILCVYHSESEMYMQITRFLWGFGPKTSLKSENSRIIKCSLPKTNVVFYLFFQRLYDGEVLLPPPPNHSWTLCSKAWTPVWVVEQFWCSYLLKGSSDIFLLLGGNVGNLQNRKVQTHKKQGMSVLQSRPAGKFEQHTLEKQTWSTRLSIAQYVLYFSYNLDLKW